MRFYDLSVVLQVKKEREKDTSFLLPTLAMLILEGPNYSALLPSLLMQKKDLLLQSAFHIP